MKKKYDIIGMTCTACQAHVYNAVSKIDGVKNVNVNLISNTMELETDNVTDLEIIKSVERAGYKAKSHDDTGFSKQSNSKRNKLIASITLLILLMYVAMGHMISLPLPYFLDHTYQHGLWFGLTQLIILIPIVVLNFNYFSNGYRRLFKLAPNMDSLVAIGATAAIVYGLYSIILVIIKVATNNPNIMIEHNNYYFEGAGTVLTLVSVGKYIESLSKAKTSNSIKMLMDLTGKTAIKVTDKDKEEEIDINDIKIGDILKVTSGMSVPVDGTIVKGEGNFDESSLTGEPLPKFYSKGDNLHSGIINSDGVVYIKATTTNKDSTLSKIIALVDEASNSKAPIAKLADKVSGVFVPVVIGLSIVSFIVWMIIKKDVSFAIDIAISVLVISCPCALGLATPIAIMISTGVAAKNHILVRNAESLQRLSEVKTVIMDKTGTITEGKLVVNEVIEFDSNFLSILGSLEKDSSHPLSSAINNYVEEHNISLKDVTKFETVKGKGIKGNIDKITYYAGNLKYIEELGLDVSSINISNHSVIVLANNEKILGYVLISDIIKSSSVFAISKFKQMGLKTVMLTGDNINNANYIKSLVDVDEVIADVLPDEKSNVIKKYQQDSKVLMIGDGINDAIALQTADIGMAIGAGSDIAIESADIILARSDLLDAFNAYMLSKKTLNDIKLSLFWAFAYNVLAIPVAMGAFYWINGFKLNPMIASLAMCISSISVVLNALRLFNFKKIEEEKVMETKVLVDGMMCEHCKAHVIEAISGIKGVTKVDVNLETKEVVITSKKELEEAVIDNAVTKAGYKVIK